MKSANRSLLALAMTMALCSSGRAEERRALLALPEDDRALVLTWLQTDCAVDDRDLVGRMMQRGSLLEGALVEAVDMGPMEDLRTATEASLPEQYADRQSWIERYGAESMGLD